jgi:N-acetylmuramic acid 6-phosphate etherase
MPNATKNRLRSAIFLGIECGGTRSAALFGPDEAGGFRRAEFGAANLRLLDDAALVRHFRTIQRTAAGPFAGIAIGMAGARTDSDKRRIQIAAGKVWPGTPTYATDDLETALAAVEPTDSVGRVLIVSGTGSCCYGQKREGVAGNPAISARVSEEPPLSRGSTTGYEIRGSQELAPPDILARGCLGTMQRTAIRIGGWGHILGDRGSGYDIGLRAVRGVLEEFDRAGKWPGLGEDILAALQLNEPNDLIDWAKGAEKSEMAALAQTVFATAAKGNAAARKLLAVAATALAADGANCARRLAGGRAPVEFVLAGSILTRQPAFARRVAAELRRLRPGARVTVLQKESAWGALALAQQRFGTGDTLDEARLADISFAPSASKELPPTEQRNPRSQQLDRMPLDHAVALMIREEGTVANAIFQERQKITRAVKMIADSMKTGGRLFYVGAGSSGRLGILDASECPPTFRTPPEMVQGIIAGGRKAIWQAVEGAEDNRAGAAAAIEHRGVRKKDVVVGIAASGRTPFVWGALEAAKARRARTILLCFNPDVKIPRHFRPDLVIAPNTGPEILTGSTRLKAGTATKIVLNIFTTLAMVRLGKVMSNLMVDVNPSNQKLRERAARMVQALTGTDAGAARAALEKSGWVIRRACRLLGRKQERGLA